jgi:hypothetical protein
MVIMVKYRKNLIRLSNLPYFLVFLFVALYLVFVSRPTMPGKPIAVTRSFFDSIVTAVFSSFSLSREMLPFYPVIVFVAAEGLDCMKPGKITRFLCVLAGSLLCFQFIIQIDVTGSRDWREDYRRRSEILHFLAAQEPGAEASGTAQEKLNSYIGANPSSVGMFYLQKLTRILDEETGLPE